MKNAAISTAVATTVLLMSQAAHADRVKGSAKADFDNDELQVPCVQIQGYSAAANGQFFDIVLQRRGNSFNYELIFAESEDAAVCEELANYAVFIDDDPEDEDEVDEVDDKDESDDVADDDSDDNDGEDVANLFASCEVRHVEGDQTRSKIKVQAKDLAAGDYYAILMSGSNTYQSESTATDDDEVELEFDSDEEEVAEGSDAIEASFISDKEVAIEFVDATTDEVVLSETVNCRVKD